MSTQIYHNPRCSKSRATLDLLQEKGVQPEVRLYLDHPPSRAELEQVLAQLGITATQLLRTGEDIYKELAAAHGEPDNATALDWMAAHPKLIERPIVIHNGRARLGRPPEQVLDILP
ncbi:MAG: arsenate reductase (glutaredoxin) [Burkholderiales bacterium]